MYTAILASQDTAGLKDFTGACDVAQIPLEYHHHFSPMVPMRRNAPSWEDLREHGPWHLLTTGLSADHHRADSDPRRHYRNPPLLVREPVESTPGLVDINLKCRSNLRSIGGEALKGIHSGENSSPNPTEDGRGGWLLQEQPKVFFQRTGGRHN